MCVFDNAYFTRNKNTFLFINLVEEVLMRDLIYYKRLYHPRLYLSVCKLAVIQLPISEVAFVPANKFGLLQSEMMTEKHK